MLIEIKEEELKKIIAEKVGKEINRQLTKEDVIINTMPDITVIIHLK